MAFYGPFLRNSDWGLASVYQWIKIHRYKIKPFLTEFGGSGKKGKSHWSSGKSGRTGQQDGQDGHGGFLLNFCISKRAWVNCKPYLLAKP
jgi:hypothetical protein